MHADAVAQLLKRASAGELLLVVSSMTIADMVRTLESFYHLTRHDIHDKILALINTPGIQLPEVDLVLQATTSYGDKHVDLINAYNATFSGFGCLTPNPVLAILTLGSEDERL